MSLAECIKMALSSLYAHKLRSLLTMLGIVIGVASIIAIVAIGKGGEEILKKQFSGSGNNTLEIYYRSKNTDEEESFSLLPKSNFTSSDIHDLLRLPGVRRVITSNSSSSPIYFRNHKINTQIIGMSEGYFDVNPIEIISGRTITNEDIEQGRKVALISQEVEKGLKEEGELIGEIIEMNGIPFKIVGVYKESKQGLFNLSMKKALVPLSVWPSLYGTDDIQSLTIQSIDANSLQQTGKNAVDFLNMKYSRLSNSEGEYYILNIEQIQKSLSTITNIMTSIIGGVAAISLIVGGIGVMNIMLVSVTERTREIGIRKALGATRKDILTQFLIESVVLTTLGGVIGIAFGVGCAYLVSVLTRWPPLVSWQVIVVGVAFSMFIGILFGMLPASTASKREPIESLRYE